MIDSLDDTLRALLGREVAGLAADAIFFDPPGKDFGAPQKGVDLFLYDVRENRDLRSNEWLEERREGQAFRRRAPVRVDCSYLITAWAGDIRSEHLLLSQVMLALLRYPTIPLAFLQGELAGADLPPPTSVLQPGHLQSLGEFWQALGGEPRAALNYTVTVAVDPFAAIEAPPVVDSVAGIREGAEPPAGRLHEQLPRG
jgi:hypothetical protein